MLGHAETFLVLAAACIYPPAFPVLAYVFGALCFMACGGRIATALTHLKQPPTMKIAIIGGGVAGLGIGWRLTQLGASVTVIERDAAGRSATWAAAGMLSAGAEAGGMGEAQIAFGREARRRWPDYARELESASGIDLRFREAGALVVAHDEAGAFALAEESQQLTAAGLVSDWLDAQDAHARENPRLRRTSWAGCSCAAMPTSITARWARRWRLRWCVRAANCSNTARPCRSSPNTAAPRA